MPSAPSLFQRRLLLSGFLESKTGESDSPADVVRSTGSFSVEANGVATPSQCKHLALHRILRQPFCTPQWFIAVRMCGDACPSVDAPYLRFRVVGTVVRSVSTTSSKLRGTYPDSRYSPVSLQSNERTQPPCPVKFATCSPDVTSYKAMIRASPPAAKSFDAGEKETLRTGWTRPAKECARRPVSLLKT
jgi:hypothetical protein